MNSNKLLKFANRACQCFIVACAAQIFESPLITLIGGAMLGLIWANNDLKQEDEK
jgi:hypothetical protein